MLKCYHIYIIKQVVSLTNSIDSVWSNPLEISIGVLPSLFSENEAQQLFIALKRRSEQQASVET